MAASMRRGFTPRSLKSASCRRRTRFSASTDRQGLIESATKPTKSASTRRTMRAKAITPASCHRFEYRSQAECLDSIFADHKSQIKKWDAEVDKLNAKAKRMSAEARAKYDEQLSAMRASRDAAYKKLQELRTTSESAWQQMEAGMDAA